MGLYAVYCQTKFNFEVSEAGIFTILNVIAAGSASFVAGKLGDKFGHKTSMMLAYLGHFIAVLLAIFAQNMFWVYGIFIAIGVGQGAFMPSAMNLVYDFAAERDTKTYMALVDSFLAPFVLLFIMGIGALVQGSNYTISLCILGTSIILGMLILQFIVRDPKLSAEASFHVDGFSS